MWGLAQLSLHPAARAAYKGEIHKSPSSSWGPIMEPVCRKPAQALSLSPSLPPPHPDPYPRSVISPPPTTAPLQCAFARPSSLTPFVLPTPLSPGVTTHPGYKSSSSKDVAASQGPPLPAQSIPPGHHEDTLANMLAFPFLSPVFPRDRHLPGTVVHPDPVTACVAAPLKLETQSSPPHPSSCPDSPLS